MQAAQRCSSTKRTGTPPLQHWYLMLNLSREGSEYSSHLSYTCPNPALTNLKERQLLEGYELSTKLTGWLSGQTWILAGTRSPPKNQKWEIQIDTILPQGQSGQGDGDHADKPQSFQFLRHSVQHSSPRQVSDWPSWGYIAAPWLGEGRELDSEPFRFYHRLK